MIQLCKGENTREQATLQLVLQRAWWKQQKPGKTQRKCYQKSMKTKHKGVVDSMLPCWEKVPLHCALVHDSFILRIHASIHLILYQRSQQLPGLDKTYQPYQWSPWFTGYFAPFLTNPFKAPKPRKLSHGNSQYTSPILTLDITFNPWVFVTW